MTLMQVTSNMVCHETVVSVTNFSSGKAATLNPMAVVDNRLRVHGVEALRVVDISLFPTQTSQNTGAPAMAVAWRAASPRSSS